ncbi:MAG: hypothetical protein M1834_008577 [Cirrosporium novae-zelandiae]|nr:MAG: hypothetical protein M1834_008577 [Cirrosporium novae-zelandiae]
MTFYPERTLVVIGSGPGIAVAVASAFAQNGFSHVALLSRDKARLSSDRETVLQNAERNGKIVQVRTWNVDITDSQALEDTFKEVQSFGTIECILFNAARVGPSSFFEFPETEIMRDFQTTNIALYNTAKFWLPNLLLSKASPDSKPTLLVTNSLLWEDPIPQLFSLSMVKAAQRNLVMSLSKQYADEKTRIGLISVGGPVDINHPRFNPTSIAERTWEYFAKNSNDWAFETIILERE